MTMMRAAVVTSFDEPPRYQPFPVPTPAGSEVLADVLAAGLHPRVRTGAAGRHYTSSGTLPMIPGIDGVGRLPDGRLVYFAAGDDVLGTMADKALVDPGRSVELPSVALRSANFRLQGSGQGSVSPRGYLAELPSLVAEISAGRIEVRPHPIPLAAVEQAWTAAETPGERTVLVP
jgi:hypothetical protein